MSAFRIRTAAVAVAATIGLSACMSPFGYGSGVSVGYGNGYGGYGGYGYPGYGSGYGYEPYWGWYDGYYYPGSGYYVYDRYRQAYPWDRYQDYWEGKRENAMSSREFRRAMEEQRVQVDQQNWSAFNQGPSKVQRVRQSDSRSNRIERSRGARSERISSSNRSSRGSERQSASDFRRSQEANRNDD